MNFLTPAEVAKATASAGYAKSKLPAAKLFVLGILAGVYIGFGANLATVVGSVWPPEFAGLSKFFFGGVFSVGLMLVVIAGAELFTGNNMFLAISAFNGQASWGGLLYNWVIVYIANFAGSLLLVGIVFAGTYYGSDAALSAVGIKAVAIAKGKLSLSWSECFFRGIGCNWLVCLAVWLAVASKDVVGKIFACFFPIMAFVTSGFEHCVANMYFVPIGTSIANTCPNAVSAVEKFGLTADVVPKFFTYGNFITSNLIPVTIGNIVGGAIFVGLVYWFTYLKDSGLNVSSSKSINK